MIAMVRHLIEAIALLAALVGCQALTAMTPDPNRARASVSDRVTAAPTNSMTIADAAGCPVTHPVRAPDDIRRDLFGSDSAYGNDVLWVGGLWPNGVITADEGFLGPDGSIGMKFGWWRYARGRLEISGRRLDGQAAPAVGDVPDGYGVTGFQASGVSFPTEGCWEVTGAIGDRALSFVTFVLKQS